MTANLIGMSEVRNKNLKGIYLDRVAVKTRERKGVARNMLFGWKPAEVSIDRWIDCHDSGFLLVPGDMRSFYDTRRSCWAFSHSEALWYGTEWIVIDYDRDDTEYSIPDISLIPTVDTEAENIFFAVCESVSSRVGHRGFRGHAFVVLETPITTRERYDALLYGLNANLKLMTGAGRQPAQVVYGNAREDRQSVYYEAVLTDADVDRFCEIGYSEYSVSREAKTQPRDNGYTPSRGSRKARTALSDYTRVKNLWLREFFQDYGVTIYTCSKPQGAGGCDEIYYTHCPFESEHTDDGGPTEASVVVRKCEETGAEKFGFQCFHEHCAQRNWHSFRSAITCPIRNTLRNMGMMSVSVSDDESAQRRQYSDVQCPRCSELGIFLFDKGMSLYACEPCGVIDLPTFQKGAAA